MCNSTSLIRGYSVNNYQAQTMWHPVDEIIFNGKEGICEIHHAVSGGVRLWGCGPVV